MENISLLDAIAAGFAIAISIGGLLMLFKGISAFQDKK